MTVELNKTAFDYARDLITEGKYVIDGRDAWSEHRPSAQRENEFVEKHGIGQYAKWHLGIDDQEDPERKGRYKFPYGDFERIGR